MARKPQHDLTDFTEWLEENRLVSPTTSRSYAGVVSAVLTALDEDISQETIDKVFLPRRGRSSYANYRTGWKAFVEFAQENGVTLPQPSKEEREVTVDPLSPEALALAVYLRSMKVSPSALRGLCWRHIKPSPTDPTSYDVFDPYRPSLAITTPKELVDALGTWGGDLPVFAEVPGSKVRYPVKLLVQQVKAERAKQQPANPKATEARSSGAAVTVEQLRAAYKNKHTEEQEEAGAAIPVELIDSLPPGEQEVGHSTTDLMNLLEKGVPLPSAQPASPQPASVPPASPREELADAVGLNAGSRGVGEHSLQAQAQAQAQVQVPNFVDSPVPVPSPSDQPTCTVCEYPREVHAIAFGLTDGTISNCAVENGYPEDACQMCDNGCYGRHSFKAKS